MLLHQKNFRILQFFKIKLGMESTSNKSISIEMQIILVRLRPCDLAKNQKLT